jgi:hypothetical protein
MPDSDSDSESKKELPDVRRKRLANARQKQCYQRSKTAILSKDRVVLVVCKEEKIPQAIAVATKRLYTIEYVKECIKDLQPITTRNAYACHIDTLFRAACGSKDMSRFLQNHNLYKNNLTSVKMMRGNKDTYDLSSLINQVKMIIFAAAIP